MFVGCAAPGSQLVLTTALHSNSLRISLPVSASLLSSRMAQRCHWISCEAGLATWDQLPGPAVLVTAASPGPRTVPGTHEMLSVSARVARLMLRNRHPLPNYQRRIPCSCRHPFPVGSGTGTSPARKQREGEMVNCGLVFKSICREETPPLLLIFHW